MTAGLNAAACGLVYWGWDIAGFSGSVPEAELYVRAMAASAFVPIMRYHSEHHHRHRRPYRDRTPGNGAEQTGDPAVIAETRQIVAVRERLVPYQARQARRAIATGRPLMRPLYFDHPADAQVWQHLLQWTLGDSILVAPVVEPGLRSWPVYLPAGQWVDAWTGQITAGAVVVQNAAPRHQAPAYVRADDWPGLRDVFTATG
jgi:alpha-glucosidase (family GH31 glycosyl hydrolase)